MVTQTPNSTLDPNTTYTMLQFMDLCKLDATVTEMVLMRICDLRTDENPNLEPHQITAIGAELLDAIERVRSGLEYTKEHPVFISILGQGPFELKGPILPIFTTIFKSLRKR